MSDLRVLSEMKPLANDPFVWAHEIISFFKIGEIFDNEKCNAMKIERFMKNCKKVLLKEKFQQMIYKLKDMATNILNLPDVCLILIF